jgi:hypothetical protein
MRGQAVIVKLLLFSEYSQVNGIDNVKRNVNYDFRCRHVKRNIFLFGVPGVVSLEMNITSPAVAAIRLHTVFLASYGFSDMTTSPDED